MDEIVEYDAVKKHFKIRKSQKLVEKESREQRIETGKEKQGKVTNEEIYQYLNDTNCRIEEIYDLLKALSK